MSGQDHEDPRRVIPPRDGLLHVLDAATYSMAGLRILWGETAARLELLGAFGVSVAFLLRGVEIWHWLVLAMLVGMTLVVEALNMAIEVLTDRVSPEWSEAARNAKDLGSLAVGIMLILTGGFVALVLFGVI